MTDLRAVGWAVGFRNGARATNRVRLRTITRLCAKARGLTCVVEESRKPKSPKSASRGRERALPKLSSANLADGRMFPYLRKSGTY